MYYGFDKDQKNAHQMHWVVHNHQSSEMRLFVQHWLKGGHRVRSISQSWIWITRMFIICYIMEELFILYHGNLSILGGSVREYAQRTGCSKTGCQPDSLEPVILRQITQGASGLDYSLETEWGLFLLEHMLYNVAAMWRKENQRCSWRLELEMAKLPLNTPLWRPF